MIVGNITGVKQRGLTAGRVAKAMQEVVNDRFPGIFNVRSRSGGFRLVVESAEDDPFLEWWYQGNGWIGGKYPHTYGQFGLWLHGVVLFAVARELKARVYDESAGLLSKEEGETSGRRTFGEWNAEHPWSGGRSYVLAHERPLCPPSLLPWYDDEFVIRPPDGRAQVVGAGVTVLHLVELRSQGVTNGQLRARFPALSPFHLNAAFKYADEHPSEIIGDCQITTQGERQ